jgi:hypothetical protein
MRGTAFKQLIRFYFLTSVSLYVLTFLIGYIVFIPIVNSNLLDFQWINAMPNPLQINETPDTLFIMKNNLYAAIHATIVNACS